MSLYQHPLPTVVSFYKTKLSHSIPQPGALSRQEDPALSPSVQAESTLALVEGYGG